MVCLLMLPPPAALSFGLGLLTHSSSSIVLQYCDLTCSQDSPFLAQAELDAMDVGDRMKRIQPFWKGLSRHERVQMMTLSVAEVKAHAKIAAKKDAEEADGTTPLESTFLSVAY